jgi:hypothetical protein
MKSKLFLEEGEISRILNMHKKAIQEQINVNGDEVETNQVQMDEELDEANSQDNTTSFTLPFYYELEPSDASGWELKLMKGLTFKKSGFGLLKAVGPYQYSDTITGAVSNIDRSNGVKMLNNNTIQGTISYNCTTGKFKPNYKDRTVSDEYYDEDKKLTPFLTKVCASKDTQTPVTPGKVTTKSKCPKLEKSILDQGFVMVTEKRYKELANNKTRKRKYVWCPISKTNLYFAKVIEGTPEKGGFPGGGNVGGGSGGGSSLPFDYNAVITAINAKCTKNDGSGGKDIGIDIDIDGEKIVPTPKMPMDVYNALG